MDDYTDYRQAEVLTAREDIGSMPSHSLSGWMGRKLGKLQRKLF